MRPSCIHDVMLKLKIALPALLTGGLLVTGSLWHSAALSRVGISLIGFAANAQGNQDATAERLITEGRQLIFKDPDASLDRLKSALKIYRQRQNKLGQQKTLEAIGSTYFFLGDLPQASNYLQKAIAIGQNNSNRLSQSFAVSAHKLLGNVYLQQGQPQKALKAFDYELQVAKTRQDSSRISLAASAFYNRGKAYLAMKDYNKASQSLQQSMRVSRSAGLGQSDPEEEAQTLFLLGYTHFLMKDRQRAEMVLLQALKLGEQSSSGLLPGITQQIDQQLEALKAAYGNNPQLLKAIEEIKNKQFSQENLRKSLKSGNLEQIDLLRAQRAETSNAAVCSLLQKIYAEQNQGLTALEISERCRARALVRRLSEKLDADTVVESIAPPNLQRIQQIAKTQKATLVQYSVLTDPQDPSALEGVEADLLMWVVPPSGKVTFRKLALQGQWLKNGQSLNDLVAKSRQTIGVRGRAAIGIKRKDNAKVVTNNEALKQLHQLLIAPIANALPQDPNQRVIFIPQGALFSVPFPALIDDSGTYLVDQHTILTAPSIDALALTRQRFRQVKKGGKQQVLVVGNPTMPKYPQKTGQVLPSLPGAEAEAKQIASLYKTKAILGGQASETTVTAQIGQARIVHFATHGLLDSPPKTPLGPILFDLGSLGRLSTPGAIALAPGNGQDGLLTSDEITKLNLNAELVVLSACDTGQGTVLNDGVVGLSRSLLTAGAPSVLVSLWKVSDQATADLMVDFYQQLKSHPDKARALRQAMLKVRQQYPNPADWAAFTLIGDAG